MSKNMGFMTIAEGVETEEQFKRLYKLECDEVQGYLTGYPIPKEQMRKVLGQQKLTMHIQSVAVNQ
jgi:EAL domain-containing protein (putative c-di-GMP-specific phosphodiesterase class I)